VARVELGSRDYEFVGRINGQQATLVGVFLLPGANALDVAKDVVKTVDEIKQRFPAGLDYSVPYDTTRFVKVSIREVVITLVEAMLLVVLVVFLFLQNWRATLIPIAAVPVSLIGTFAGLYLLGYSINTLTLFGMVLAIGIVVDDAIVVLENIERIMHEEHLAAREAAIKAMQEVSGPVIAIVLVLCSVFVPIAFLGGLAGELYRQFAVTIAIAVVISGIVALTLTPSLCVLILKREHKSPGRFFTAFNDWFHRFTDRYENGVGWMIRRAALGMVLFGGMVALAVFLWRITPGSLVPDEDQGFYIAAVILPTRTRSPSPASTSSAATSATTRRRSSSRRSTGTSARSRRSSWSASSTAAPRTSRKAWCSPSRRRRSSASARPAASSSTCRTAARAGPSVWRK
jgi:HAE1 family hydrophobic/amphiphilic exporter-1/multidrug efflux pump